MILKMAFFDKIRSGSSASALICEFIEAYSSFNCIQEQLEYFQFILCAATEHNHPELVKLLMFTVGDIHKNDSECIRRALYLAIWCGNVALVEFFLRSSASLKMLENRFTPVGTYSYVGPRMDERDPPSLIQYACFRDEREILKLLLAYHRHQTSVSRSCVERVSDLQRILDADAQCIPPLHVVMQLVSNDQFRAKLTLPLIVQLVLDAKIDVDVRYLTEYTALTVLGEEVMRMVRTSIDMNIEECDMIVETARVLLAAGSVAPDRSPPFNFLVMLSFEMSHLFLHFPSTATDVNKYGMLIKLIKTYLQHGAKLSEEINIFGRILCHTTYCAWEYNMTTDPIKRQVYRMIINNMADAFSYFLLSNIDAMKSLVLSNDQVTNLHGAVVSLDPSFMYAFVPIAGYSSVPGESRKFVRMLLNYMSASQLNQLKMQLRKATVTHWPDDESKFAEHLQTALRLVESVVVPLSLQHLARRAIIRAMSYRCLGEVDWSSLYLPKTVLEDLLPYIK